MFVQLVPLVRILLRARAAKLEIIFHQGWKVKLALHVPAALKEPLPALVVPQESLVVNHPRVVPGLTMTYLAKVVRLAGLLVEATKKIA